MSIPTYSSSGGLPPVTQPRYVRPTNNQPYLPDADWTKPVAARDNINETATTPEDQQLQVAAANAPLRVIYGRTRVGAQIADVLVYQSKLILIAVWCEGEIDAIETLEMADKALPAGVTATHYTGTAGQTANATLIAAYASHGITYASALPGIAYSVIEVPEGASEGFPTFAATIRGRKLYDPRTATTVYSDNPALALADFLSNAVYGLDKTVAWSTVSGVANDCDALVGAEKRRIIGLACDNVSAATQWIDTLRTYASCFVVQGSAGVRLISDKAGASVFSFGASSIVGKSLRLKKRGIQQIPTVMRITYTDTTVIPWKTGTAEVLAAGVATGTTPRRESTVSLPGIQRYSQAYREAVERINKLTLGDMSCGFTGFDEALAVEVGDIITVTHPIGLSVKRMRVTVVTSQSPGRPQITAAEYDPAMYSNVVSAEPTYADTNLPNPASPPAITGLAAVEEVYQLENGTYSSRLRATWIAVTYPYLKEYRVEVYQAGVLIHAGNTISAVFPTGPLQEGVEYVVRVAAITTIGTVGAWAQANVTAAGKFLIPGNVPSVTVFEAGGTVYGSCAPVIDIDIFRYEWRYGAVSTTWETSPNLIDRVDALRMTSAQIPVGTWRIFVKALDSVGQYSATAAFADVTVTSDASAFLVDSYNSNAPTLTAMQAFTLARTDPNTYYVTEDNVAWDTKFSAAMDTYTRPLADYHTSVTSTWLGEPEDFGQLLGGQWTGTSTVVAVSGALISYLGFATAGSAPADFSFLVGLSQRTNARFAKLKHEALTTATLLVTVPTQNIRLDAIPREEVGTGTSLSTGLVRITLVNRYVATKKLTITPQGTTARSATFDNIVLGNPTTFDVYIFNDAGAQIASAFQYAFQGV